MRKLLYGAVAIAILAGVVALYGIAPCDYVGGFQRGPNWQGAQTCQCLGVRYMIRDQAPIDGITESVCVGVLRSRTCSKSAGGVVRERAC